MNVYVIDKSSMVPVRIHKIGITTNMLFALFICPRMPMFLLVCTGSSEAIITCGSHKYPVLASLPVQYRGRWVHVAQSDITVHLVRTCAQGLIFNDDFRQPCLSIFTTAFASGNRIGGTYRSIVAQTTKLGNGWSLTTLAQRNVEKLFRNRLLGKIHGCGFIDDIQTMGLLVLWNEMQQCCVVANI